MRLNSIAKRCVGSGALAYVLVLATPAFAHGSHADDMPPPMGPPPGGEMPMPPMPGPGMDGTGWRGGPPPMMRVDPRARDAWLDECRHRIYYRDHYYRDYDRADDASRGDYDYCEAYFDDWYAHFGQGGYTYGAYGYAQPMPMMMVPVRHQVRDRDCVREVVSEDVPVRRRIIYRARRIPDKRVRIAPDKRVPTQ